MVKTTRNPSKDCSFEPVYSNIHTVNKKCPVVHKRLWPFVKIKRLREWEIKKFKKPKQQDSMRSNEESNYDQHQPFFCTDMKNFSSYKSIMGDCRVKLTPFECADHNRENTSNRLNVLKPSTQTDGKTTTSIVPSSEISRNCTCNANDIKSGSNQEDSNSIKGLLSDDTFTEKCPVRHKNLRPFIKLKRLHEWEIEKFKKPKQQESKEESNCDQHQPFFCTDLKNCSSCKSLVGECKVKLTPFECADHNKENTYNRLHVLKPSTLTNGKTTTSVVPLREISRNSVSKANGIKRGRFLTDEEVWNGIKGLISEEVLVLPPSVCLKITLSTPEDILELNSNIDLNKRIIVAPISNAAIDELSGYNTEGTHWTLVIINVQNKEYFHFDSLPEIKKSSALQFCKNINILLKFKPLKFFNKKCKIQKDEFSCGWEVIKNAKRQVEVLKKLSKKSISTHLFILSENTLKRSCSILI